METLLCITTCKRLNEVRKNIVPYLQFCNANLNYHFVLALDGYEKEYIDFCENHNIPLIYSKEREGVGISKNRVLKQFPNYEYYFFIEDDVELLHSKVFDFHINLSRKCSFHHLTVATMIPERIIKNEKCGKVSVTYASKAGAFFSFYTKTGLDKVGGWNELFAKYKRFGHTEHTYRYLHSGISFAPFIVVESMRKHIILNSPPHVTEISVATNENQLIEEEQALIDAKTRYHPIVTLSEFFFNNKDVSISKLNNAFQGKRYALIHGKEKYKALGNYYLHKFIANKNPILLILSMILYPQNNLLKFYIKKKLGLWKSH